MNYFRKDAEEKIWEAVHKIDHLNIEDNDMYKQTIYDIIEDFGKWLHQRTCENMIDID
jgi:predicted DNA-binding protein (UPF0278 family)